YVYVVRNGRLLRQPVVTGINNGSKIEIVSGLTEKESVVKTYNPGLTAGARVIAIALGEHHSAKLAEAGR
ncbi:MAG: hypothetical protein ACREQ4_08945, partial [Candidatus Binataceae bacterium]